MDNRLYIIGNGFDLAHRLPTKFDPNFKEIAEKNEFITYFWDLYQTQVDDIWSDFENLLGHPDFGSLSEIFENFYPDYSSDHESDRDSIILQAQLNGNLSQSLVKFAIQADEAVNTVMPIIEYVELFNDNDSFINFNYTHTLEKLYQIKSPKILHIHGEVGINNLILGYPEGNYSPEDIEVDIRMKGRGPYSQTKYIDFINEIEDYYIRTAYEELVNKTKSFSKSAKIELLEDFIGDKMFDEIYVKGHSLAVDFPYFEWLNNKFPNCKWEFDAFDIMTRKNIEKIVIMLKIKNYCIN